MQVKEKRSQLTCSENNIKYKNSKDIFYLSGRDCKDIWWTCIELDLERNPHVLNETTARPS